MTTLAVLCVGVLAGLGVAWWAGRSTTTMWKTRALDADWASDELKRRAREAQQRLRFQTVWRATTGAERRQTRTGAWLPLRDSGPAPLPGWASRDIEPDWAGESFNAAGAPSPRWVDIGETPPLFVPPEWGHVDDTLKLRIRVTA